MANKVWKGIIVKLDGSTGSITDITSSVNNVTFSSETEMLDDTSLNDEERSYVAGLAGGTFEFNAWSNSTTDPMFQSVMVNRTTATRTFKYYNGAVWWQCETLISNAEISGEAGQLQAWSVTCTIDGPATNTTS